MDPLPQSPLNYAVPGTSYAATQTPMKDIPSLGFGSSSSPFFESPASVGPSPNFVRWSSSQAQQFTDTSKMHVPGPPQLLPSQFPPASFNTLLPSSPPDMHKHPMQADLGSPRPKKRRRGRPRKYVIESGSPHIASGAGVHKQCVATTGTWKSTSVYTGGGHQIDRNVTRSNEFFLPRSHIDTQKRLLSSKAFSRACEVQSTLTRRPETGANAVTGHRVNGLASQLTVDGSGQATFGNNGIFSMSRKNINTKEAVRELLGDDLDSDSENEGDGESGATLTPPRFSSLGSCDAASAFARTLARTREQGKGSLFLFPIDSTPDKQAHLKSFIPCTPRTPKTASSIEDTPFSFQMQTPPGAILSYDTSAGLYGTGLTPFLASAARNS